MFMKKLKITFLILYIILVCVLIFESALPGNKSSKRSDFVSKIIGNIVNIFVKDKYVYPEDIETIDLKEEYYVGDKINISAKVFPYDSSYQELIYSSNNTDVCTIDEFGNITCINKGDAIISIIQEDYELKKEVNVKIVDKPITPPKPIINVSDISFTMTNTSVLAGSILNLSTQVLPTDATNKTIKYSLDNNELAVIKGSKLYALKSGTLTLTATSSNDIKKNITIIINDNTVIKPTKFSIDGKSELYVGESYNVNLDMDAASDIYKDITYTSSDTSVISIDKFGKIVAKGIGTSTITARTFDSSFKKSYDIKVSNIMPIFSLDDSSISLGKTLNVDIKLENNPTYNVFTYTSSNPEVAKVDVNGLITPKSKGETIITVICFDGVQEAKESFVLKVKDQNIYDKITFNFNLLIRKLTGHFFAFMILGLFGFFTYFLWIKKKIYVPLSYPITLVSGFAVAGVTELIQLFTPGRYGSMKDVLIDFSGYAVSSVVLIIIFVLIDVSKRRKAKNINDIN